MRTVGIVGGTGAMGSLFSKFFKNAGFKVLVSGRNTRLSARELCSQSDWTIFCVPIAETAKIIAENARFAKKGAIVSDFTSVKEGPLKAMMKHSPKGCSVVGIHPLFGPNVKGLMGQNVVLVKGRGENGFAFVEKFFKAQGAKAIECKAREHDELMGIVQGANHFSNLAFAFYLAGCGKGIERLLEISTPNFRLKLALISRILKQNPSLYFDLILENKQSLKQAKDYCLAVKRIEKIIIQKDRCALEKEILKVQKRFSGKMAESLFQKSGAALECFSK